MDAPNFQNNIPSISRGMHKLLNKKVNVIAREGNQRNKYSGFFIPSHSDLSQIKLSYLKRIKTLIIAFSLLFLYISKLQVCIAKSEKIKRNKIVLIYSLTKDQIFENNSLHSFHNFLTSKRFNYTEKQDFFIECRGIRRTKKYSNLIVTFDIPLKLFAVKFSMKQQLKLLFEFSRNLLIIIKSFNNSQYMYLVFKEFIFDESVYRLLMSENQVREVITGPGNHKYQPVVFEMSEFVGERIMLWYSSNSLPIKYKSREIMNTINPTEIFLQEMAIDTHWVWTSQQKKYLIKLTKRNVLVQGSMVFYECPKKIKYDKKYDVVIFDVTPQTGNTMWDKIATFPIAKEFIEDIIDSVKLVSNKLNKNINIHIKHKRAFHQGHSSEYISFIDNLVNNGELFRLPLSSNLYEIAAQSKLIIGFPFTSPVIIGQELKIPSIYYLSSDIIVKYNQSNFIQNRFKLQNFLEKNLGG